MSAFGYLLLLPSDLASSDIAAAAAALAADISESRIQLDIVAHGDDPRDSTLANRTLEELGRLPRKIIADARLDNPATVQEFYDDHIAPALIQGQSVVLLVRASVTGALRNLIDPNPADTILGRPELFRFDRELRPIRFRP